MGVGAEGVVMAQNVLLNGLVHISSHCQEMLWTIFVSGHLLDSGSISQQSLFVTHVAFNQLLISMLVLSNPLLHSEKTLLAKQVHLST